MSDAGFDGFDVVAVGSAIVDLLVRVGAADVAAAGLEPGTMTLIDAPEADRLWGHFGSGPGGEDDTGGGDGGRGAEVSVVAGGSAANTAVGVAALGGRSALVGRVGADPLGAAYVADLARAGVVFEAPPAMDSAGSGRCFIIVTPDGERTMRTYLGAAPQLGPECVPEPLLEGTGFVYLEGYLWDAPAAAGALTRAVEGARSSGARIALSLSDPGCVERHRDAFEEMIRSGQVDLLFANESEITRLWGVSDIAAAAEATRPHCPTAALTLGSRGSVVIAGESTVRVPAPAVEVVDTTGAGDLYAAGFMVGMCRGLDPGTSARLGALAARDIISALGARPHGDIRAAARAEGLLP